MLYWFQVQQNDSVIHTYVSILSQVLFLFRVLQNTEQLLFEVGKTLRKTGFRGKGRNNTGNSVSGILYLNCLLALPVEMSSAQLDL